MPVPNVVNMMSSQAAKGMMLSLFEAPSRPERLHLNHFEANLAGKREVQKMRMRRPPLRTLQRRCPQKHRRTSGGFHSRF